MESWTFDNQLYRPGADPSSTRSTSNAVARTAIPITHYRILSKQQPAATPRLVAKGSRRVVKTHECSPSNLSSPARTPTKTELPSGSSSVAQPARRPRPSGATTTAVGMARRPTAARPMALRKLGATENSPPVLYRRLPLRLAKRSPRRRELGRCPNSSVARVSDARIGDSAALALPASSTEALLLQCRPMGLSTLGLAERCSPIRRPFRKPLPNAGLGSRSASRGARPRPGVASSRGTLGRGVQAVLKALGGSPGRKARNGLLATVGWESSAPRVAVSETRAASCSG